ncbi:MAG: hypothetical protein ACR2OX_09585 [Methyloligellaceae bacterium]
MVFEDFRKHGASVITAVRETDPAYYIKLCAATVPRGLNETIDPIEKMTDDELIARARQLAAQLGIEFTSNARGAARKKRSKQA